LLRVPSVLRGESTASFKISGKLRSYGARKIIFMSKYAYRVVNLRLVSQIVPAELDSVLVAVPAANLELARALPDHQDLDEDELFRSLLTRDDYRLINELLDVGDEPDGVEYLLDSFREKKKPPAPHRTSKDGKKFWRLGSEPSPKSELDSLRDVEAEPLPPMAPA
jgi:hypothetical protein